MDKNAVTMIEVLIVIIIIAILTAIGIPVYTYRIERTRGEKAIANIELIKDALKMYYIKNSAEPNYSITTPLSNINNILDLELTDSYFSYNISNPGTYRRIQSIRNSGIYNTNSIMYSIDPTDGIPAENWDYTNSNWPWMP